MKIGKHAVATLHYILKDDAEEVLDMADESQPFVYLHGVGGMIPGLEEALDGSEAGQNITVSVPPEKAYGVRDDNRTQDVPREMFAGVDDKEMFVGAQFHAQTGDGMEIVSVVGIDGDTIKIDGNHPMADETLHFDVTVVSIREATQEEIAHGHPHGPDGCGHG